MGCCKSKLVSTTVVLMDLRAPAFDLTEMLMAASLNLFLTTMKLLKSKSHKSDTHKGKTKEPISKGFSTQARPKCSKTGHLSVVRAIRTVFNSSNRSVETRKLLTTRLTCSVAPTLLELRARMEVTSKVSMV